MHDSLGQSFKPTSLAYDRTDTDSALSVVESIQNKEVLKSSLMVIDSIRMIIAILVLGAIIGSVVLYNLGALLYIQKNKSGYKVRVSPDRFVLFFVCKTYGTTWNYIRSSIDIGWLALCFQPCLLH